MEPAEVAISSSSLDASEPLQEENHATKSTESSHDIALSSSSAEEAQSDPAPSPNSISSDINPEIAEPVSENASETIQTADDAVEEKKEPESPTKQPTTTMSFYCEPRPKWPNELTQGTNLTSLERVSIHTCGLTAIPKAVSKLTSLRALLAPENDIVSVTKHLTALKQLDSLELSGNELEISSFIPETMQQMTQLTQLSLSHNKLTQFPEWILSLQNLKTLDISGNSEIAEIPEEIGSLVQLTSLNVNNTGIHDLPKNISRLTALTYLNVGANYLEDLPKGFRRLTSLRSLNISHNEFVDFPPPLLKCVGLETLISGGNIKKISIPKSLSIKFSSDRNEVPDLIMPNLYLGSLECAQNKAFLKTRNITHIVTVIVKPRPLYPDEFWYHHIPVEDLDTTNLSQHFEAAHVFIDSALDSGAAVLVHCAAGISRSASIVTSYVMKKQQLPFKQALAHVITKRPIVCPNMAFRQQLEEYEKALKKSRCVLS